MPFPKLYTNVSWKNLVYLMHGCKAAGRSCTLDIDLIFVHEHLYFTMKTSTDKNCARLFKSGV